MALTAVLFTAGILRCTALWHREHGTGMVNDLAYFLKWCSHAQEIFILGVHFFIRLRFCL